MRTNLVKTSLLIFLIVSTACKQQAKTPVVSAVFPSSDVVPENLLRLYVQFSQPMKTVNNLEKLKLIDEKGNEVKNVFFNNVYELWNKEQTQLTLILDPARVKTGLVANETFGHALKPEHNYTLIIEDLEDVYHQKMESRFEKKFVIIKADIIAPNIDQWNVILPKANSSNALRVQFPEMLDYTSLQQRLIVTNSEKEAISGSVSIVEKETEWQFKPNEHWQKGSYIVHINTRLEDPSGNNLNGLFDHKIGSLKNEQEGKIETITFNIN